METDAFIFVGTELDINKEYPVGTVYLDTNSKSIYYKDENTWLEPTEIIGIKDTDSAGYYEPMHFYHKVIPAICPHCGAPTNPGLDKCDYCEVYFEVVYE